MRGKLPPCRAPRWAAAKGFNEARALCAGSSARQLERRPALQASMRPAHYAREVDARRQQRWREAEKASMRPAHYAREVPQSQANRTGARRASMRPAHYAREVQEVGVARVHVNPLQ